MLNTLNYTIFLKCTVPLLHLESLNFLVIRETVIDHVFQDYQVTFCKAWENAQILLPYLQILKLEKCHAVVYYALK